MKLPIRLTVISLANQWKLTLGATWPGVTGRDQWLLLYEALWPQMLLGITSKGSKGEGNNVHTVSTQRDISVF